jgi:hypothetical protein
MGRVGRSATEAELAAYADLSLNPGLSNEGLGDLVPWAALSLE